MIVAGFVYDVDYSYLKKYNYLLGKIGVKLNQIAKRINETKSIYLADMDEIKEEMEKFWKVQKAMLERIERKEMRDTQFLTAKYEGVKGLRWREM